MKKLIILTLLLLAIPAHAESWDTAGNNVTANDFIGTTNYLPFKIRTNNIERVQFNNDGMRFQSPLWYITNSNGQYVFGHSNSTGCTAIFGNVSKILNICSDGFNFTGGTVNFKTKYYIYDEGGSYTLSTTDYTVESTGGEIIVPTATGVAGKHYEIINVSQADLPMHTSNGQLIGNESEYQIPVNGSVTIVSNGSMWRIVGKS